MEITPEEAKAKIKELRGKLTLIDEIIENHQQQIKYYTLLKEALSQKIDIAEKNLEEYINGGKS